MKALLALLSFLTLADTTITTSIPGHDSMLLQVQVSEGKTSIEAFSYGDRADLSCSFIDVGTGQVVLKQTHTHHCYGITNDLVLPSSVVVKVTNNQSYPIQVVVQTTSIPHLK